MGSNGHADKKWQAVRNLKQQELAKSEGHADDWLSPAYILLYLRMCS